MTNPEFSVIIPTLNRPLELAECLRALSEMEYPRERFEVIVVDDGGTFPLAETLTKYGGGAKISTLRQACMGPGVARNSGAAISRGRYLAFTDDDCIPAPDWLSAIEKTLRSDKHLLVGGRVLNALPDNPYATASQIIVDFVNAYYRSGRDCPRFFATNNVAMHAETFRKLGGFAAAFRTSEDRDFCDRWLAAGYRLVYAPDAVIHHAHRLNLQSFWKQHMGYGRGAWRFYRAYRSRHMGQSSIDPNFYWTLLCKLPGLVMRQTRKRAFLFSLMEVWQIANLAGFLAEAVSSRKSVRKGIEQL